MSEFRTAKLSKNYTACCFLTKFYKIHALNLLSFVFRALLCQLLILLSLYFLQNAIHGKKID